MPRRPTRALVVAGALLALAPAGANAADARRSSPERSGRASSPSGVVVLRAARAAAVPAAGIPAAGVPSAGRPARPRIVGGTPIAISAAPYQVRVRARKDGRPWGSPGAFRYATCGGALIDELRVVTAAHCVVDGRTAVPAGSFRVDTGSTRFASVAGLGADPLPQAGDTPQSRLVAGVRRHPGFRLAAGDSGSLEDLADDVAVLTLAAPVVVDANTAPIALADPGPSPLGVVRVSGFGLQQDGGRSDGVLYALDAPLIDAARPASAEGAGGLNAVYAISRSPTGSTCQGDSGGPVVHGGRLIGVVSSGPSCGPGSPTNHALLAAPEIRDFVLGDDTPPVAPRGGQDVGLRTPRVPRTRDVLRCAPGTWSGSPSFVVTFVDTRTGAVLQSGPSARYALTPADLRRTIACRAVATTPGGVGRTPQTRPTRPVAQGPRARLRVRLTSADVVRGRRGRLALRVAVRNVGPVAATAVRTCVRPGPRFRVTRRGGGTIVAGRVCWTISSLTHGTARRFELRLRRGARPGRTLAARASVTASYVARAAASHRVTVRR